MRGADLSVLGYSLGSSTQPVLTSAPRRGGDRPVLQDILIKRIACSKRDQARNEFLQG